MIDLLIKTLEPLGYPIIRQGSLNKEEPYPETFFTFWNNDSDDTHYDDKANNCVWDFDLNVYSNKHELTNSLLLQAKEKLIEAGFIVSGKGYDVASDEITHTGRGINVQIIE